MDRRLRVNPEKDYEQRADHTPEQWRKLLADIRIGATLENVRDKSFARYCLRNDWIMYEPESW